MTIQKTHTLNTCHISKRLRPSLASAPARKQSRDENRPSPSSLAPEHELDGRLGRGAAHGQLEPRLPGLVHQAEDTRTGLDLPAVKHLLELLALPPLKRVEQRRSVLRGSRDLAFVQRRHGPSALLKAPLELCFEPQADLVLHLGMEFSRPVHRPLAWHRQAYIAGSDCTS